MRDPVRLQPAAALNERARAYFKTDATLPYAFRRERLQALGAAIRTHQPKILEAMHADLGKGLVEAYVSEVAVVMKDIHYALGHLKSWMRQRRVPTSMFLLPGRSSLVPQPLGAALIMAPWNYPMNLLLAPLVGAIAAGCTAVLKPGEAAANVAKVMGEVVQTAFGDDGYVTVVNGGVDVSERLLEERWDHIFFTGSPRVGRVVMAAAAKHLTPVTLELGGKNPTLVDEGIDLEVASRRIAWGRFYNAGQTCLATDFVLVKNSVKAALVEKIKARTREFYGDDPKQSRNYSRIISAHHVRRLKALLGTGEVVMGGDCDEEARYFAPTMVLEPALDSPLMQEETFGPILPVVGVETFHQAVELVRERPKPLALYAFTNDRANQEEVLRRTSSGHLCINDAVAHFASDTLPFGGVGESGMGAYHGKASFDAFSHHKPVLRRYFFGDLPMRYPNSTAGISFWKRILG